MTTAARVRFEALLSGFFTDRSLSELDRAILDYTVDGWPMVNLAKQNITTRNVLHMRKKELMADLREYLKSRGISSSSDILDE